MDAVTGERVLRGLFGQLRDWARWRGLPFVVHHDGPGRVVCAVDGRGSLQMTGSRSEMNGGFDLSVKRWKGPLPPGGLHDESHDPEQLPVDYYTLAEEYGVVGCRELKEDEHGAFVALDQLFAQYTEWLLASA